MAKLHSYVVRYDSGFAPNPFYGYCTLATCKPDIRRSAAVGDWIVGTASDAQPLRRGGHLVYAMQVTEILTFDGYSQDSRFARKRPFRRGSRKQSSGDNIYYRKSLNHPWSQRDSFHSFKNGLPNPQHIARDTKVNRVLISERFVYFGGTGPVVPSSLCDADGRYLCKHGIGRYVFADQQVIDDFAAWLQGLGAAGYEGPPQEWLSLRNR